MPKLVARRATTAVLFDLMLPEVSPSMFPACTEAQGRQFRDGAELASEIQALRLASGVRRGTNDASLRDGCEDSELQLLLDPGPGPADGCCTYYKWSTKVISMVTFQGEGPVAKPDCCLMPRNNARMDAKNIVAMLELKPLKATFPGSQAAPAVEQQLRAAYAVLQQVPDRPFILCMASNLENGYALLVERCIPRKQVEVSECKSPASVSDPEPSALPQLRTRVALARLQGPDTVASMVTCYRVASWATLGFSTPVTSLINDMMGVHDSGSRTSLLALFSTSVANAGWVTRYTSSPGSRLSYDVVAKCGGVDELAKEMLVLHHGARDEEHPHLQHALKLVFIIPKDDTAGGAAWTQQDFHDALQGGAASAEEDGAEAADAASPTVAISAAHVAKGCSAAFATQSADGSAITAAASDAARDCVTAAAAAAAAVKRLVSDTAWQPPGTMAVIVSDYAGETLRHWLHVTKWRPTGQGLVQLALNMGDALAAMHMRGWTVRDVSWNNFVSKEALKPVSRRTGTESGSDSMEKTPKAWVLIDFGSAEPAGAPLLYDTRTTGAFLSTRATSGYPYLPVHDFEAACYVLAAALVGGVPPDRKRRAKWKESVQMLFAADKRPSDEDWKKGLGMEDALLSEAVQDAFLALGKVAWRGLSWGAVRCRLTALP